MMTEKELLQLSNMLSGLSAMFGKRLPEDALAGYIRGLKGYSFEDVSKAMDSLARKEKFMPRLAAFVNEIENGGVAIDDLAVVAYQKALLLVRKVGSNCKTITFEDARLANAINAMGGWVRFCEDTEDLAHPKQFYAVYRAQNNKGNGAVFGRFWPDGVSSPKFAKCDYLPASAPKALLVAPESSPGAISGPTLARDIGWNESAREGQ